MEQIISLYEFITSRDNDQRIYVALPDGRKIARARLVMMNYLHTSNIPSRIHIHHFDKNTFNDMFDNLEILKDSDHILLHKNPMNIPYKERRSTNLKKYNNSYKAKQRVKKWKENNKDHTAQYFKQYYHDNRKQLNEYKKEWRQKQLTKERSEP
jgi:hypothetical protein